MHEKDFLNAYQDALNGIGGHLSHAAISVWLNFHDELSRKERAYVESHLHSCTECRSLHDEVFDAELDMEEGPEEVTLRRAPSASDADGVEFRSDSDAVTLRIDQKEATAQFIALPVTVSHARILDPAGRVLARIPHAKRGSRIPWSVAEPLSVLRMRAMETPVAQQHSSDSAWWYSAAAVLLVALVIGSILYLIPGRTSDHISERTPLPSQDLVATHEPDPARFTPNTILETFMERTLRSPAAARIISPAGGDTVAVPFPIVWEGKPATVSIVDNHNRLVWERSLRGVEAMVEDPIESGLYYIKLNIGGNLVQISRVVVRDPQR